jgi:aspartate carbamoyltransferase regulatory subunit
MIETRKEPLAISRITNGTVIDHIRPGYVMLVLRILGYTEVVNDKTRLATNVKSRKYGTKDILMLDERYLTENQISKIAIISRRATVNIIRNGILEKRRVEAPDEAVNVFVCYSNCASYDPHQRAHLPTRFKKVASEDGDLRYRCYYCRSVIEEQDFMDHLII